MKIYFAPMEGITTWSYRRIYEKHFGQIDKYVTPFLSPCQDRCFTHRELQEILPEHNEGMQVVPQLLTCRSEDFIWAARELKQMGYEEVNLNLGCPSGTVVSKRKGSGFLAYPKELDEFLARIFDELDMKISIKTRIGKERPEEFSELLSIYNRYPISELIIHPRVQKEFYKGTPHMDVFAAALRDSRNPVCYNGDLFTGSDVQKLQESFPQVQTIMLGRGLIANPALVSMLAGMAGAEPGGQAARLEARAAGQEKNAACSEADRKRRLRQFHDELYHQYQETMPGERPVLFKMKELWFYMICLFEDSERLGKKLRKSQHLREYEEAVEGLFAEKTLLVDTRFRG
ncbi:MAG: tRNA-dihydrouridine synthase family protein [Lachnospiraceae bacterium]|nr:tRNA-dihydrouridine synthase family protein [Lachnospiraceae bacterium]